MKTPKDANIRISKEARKILKLAAIKKGITLKALINWLAFALEKRTK